MFLKIMEVRFDKKYNHKIEFVDDKSLLTQNLESTRNALRDRI